NLVGNALKFTEPGGSITVRGAVSEGGVHLSVIDTGAGIPREDLARIFDRFAQVDDSATRRHEGTGIGLSLVSELVELHEGRVWAESEGLGHGSTMNVFLPWGESDGDEDEEVLQHESGDSIPLGRSIEAMEAELDHHGDFDGDGRFVELERSVERHEGHAGERVVALEGDHGSDVPEVLVAEDNTEMRRLLGHLLGSRYRLRLAPNGRLAFEAAIESVPDLVLTDVMMPEISGTELCKALKNNPRTAHVPVVLVTSKAEREMKIEGLELGADDYVTKPFHPRELIARVGSLVRVARLQGELAERNTTLEETNEELERAMAELKEAEVQIVQAERLTAVGELAAGVAHEVNNPLNFARNSLAALRTYVDDIREVAQAVAELDPNDPAKLPQQLEELDARKAELGFDEAADELAELVGITTEGLDRTQRLVADLRDFAAPTAGSDSVADLKTGLQSTLALLKHAAQVARVEIVTDFPEGLPRVCGNARALNQVFLNLLKNALEAFDGAEGMVHVRLREDGDAVLVEFEDNGPGIDPAVSERLFEPFVTSKAAGKGTGLGLSISQRIVREHGGDITVRSEPGRGTCFTVRLRAEGTDAD
ncbi:MAG: ATP-binding protein, partial [Myxococcales bacterium]|nr:ATP-binding protein [Myxococcales bacterium]